MKTVKERTNLDLLQLTLELYARSFQVTTKEMHNAYLEARQELETRLQVNKTQENVSGQSGLLLDFCKFHHKRFNLANAEQADLWLIKPFLKSNNSP